MYQVISVSIRINGRNRKRKNMSRELSSTQIRVSEVCWQWTQRVGSRWARRSFQDVEKNHVGFLDVSFGCAFWTFLDSAGEGDGKRLSVWQEDWVLMAPQPWVREISDF